MDQVREEIRKEMKTTSEAQRPSEGQSSAYSEIPMTSWGGYDPGKGFLIANTPNASMNFNGYMLVRYLNQMPAEQSFTDHLGRTQSIHARSDFSAPHRVLMNLYGFVFDKKFNY